MAKLLTKLLFEPKGKHDPTQAYTIKDTVMSADGSQVYFALQNVPVGIQLNNTEYWILQIDLSETKADMEAATDAANAAAEDASQLSGQVEQISGDVAQLTEEIGNVVSDLYTASDNLFDYAAIRANEIPRLDIGSNDTDFVAFNGWYTSNYIPVVGGEQYCVVYDSSITMRQFVVAYYKDGILISKDNPSTNPFTVPADADHVYIVDGSGTLFTANKTSVKKYSSGMDPPHSAANCSKSVQSRALMRWAWNCCFVMI